MDGEQNIPDEFITVPNGSKPGDLRPGGSPLKITNTTDAEIVVKLTSSPDGVAVGGISFPNNDTNIKNVTIWYKPSSTETWTKLGTVRISLVQAYSVECRRGCIFLNCNQYSQCTAHYLF
jgi:hypothetical protein